jgi:hypothetical protein
VTAAQLRRRDVRRRAVVYGFECFDVNPRTGRIRTDPDTGEPRLRIDYVGQTRQLPKAREEQHRDDKPWADLIVRMVILETGMWTDAELDAREEAAIRRVRPRYNYTHNLANPERIEMWRQPQQRAVRDALRTPAVAGYGLLSPHRSDYARRFDPRSWPCWARKVCLLSATWALTTGLIWADIIRNGWLPPGYAQPAAAALLTGATLVVCLCRRQPRRRRRLRR